MPKILFVLLAVVAVSAGSSSAQLPFNESAFSYQGRLDEGDDVFDGPADFAFTIYRRPVGGTPPGLPIARTIDVMGGLFTTLLEFGYEALDTRQVYLEIQVGPVGGPLTTLEPRHRITASPLALQASGATIRSDAYVELVRGRALSADVAVRNEGPADDFELDSAFTQVFIVPGQEVLDTIRIELKRPLSTTPPPSVMRVFEGVGTSGAALAEAPPAWENEAGSGAQDVVAGFGGAGVLLVPGQPYTFAVSSSANSVSRAPITGEGVGASSGGSGVASVFSVAVVSFTNIGIQADAAEGLRAPRLFLSDRAVFSTTDTNITILEESPKILVGSIDDDADRPTPISLVSRWKRFSLSRPRSKTTSCRSTSCRT